MNSRGRIVFYASMILLLALVSAISVIPARADDGAPPPAVPAAPSGPATEVTTAAAPTILSQVPAGTNVVVVNDRGHKVSLASQEAAKIVATGDPLWCPAGAAPKPGLGGCTAAYTDLDDLVSAFTSNAISEPTTNGVIWITGYITNGNAADSSATAITIDGANASLGTWQNFSLALKGGWTGTSAGTINTSDASVFNVPLTITNWKADVTLSDITINGIAGTGLTVVTTKNITLTRVTSSNDTSGGKGADIDNTSGTGNIIVTSSEFDNNVGGGLLAKSNGSITINNIIANGNGLHAVALDNSTASSAQVVSMTGTNTINGNFYGLDIESVGAITISNLTANSNPEGYGAYLKNSTAATAQKVTLTGTNYFNSDFGGLEIISKGTITLNNVTANLNTNNAGVYLNNTAGTADVMITSGQFNNNVLSDGLYVWSNGAITLNGVTADLNGSYYGVELYNSGAASAKNVTLTGTLEFNDNGNTGLVIWSTGALSLNNIDAIGNNGYGAYLDNRYGVLGVTLTGVNVFSENSGGGLEVYSNGAIKASNLVVDENGNWGAYLNNGYTFSAQPVTLTGTNEFKFNHAGLGLQIESMGAITLNNITSSYNGGGGLFIQDTLGLPTSPQNVTVTGYGIFNNNGWNGLEVYTYGAITLANTAANYNGNYGAYLNNYGIDPAFINGNATLPKPVTMTVSGSNAENMFDNNNSGGLVVYSLGAINLTGLDAENNPHGDGATLENNYLGAVGGITFSGWGPGFGNNGGNGLYALSRGAITASNIWAWGNSLGGAYLDNTAGTGAVTLGTSASNSYASFGNNGWDGLDVYSNGAITLHNVTANGSLNGALLDNSTGTGGITIDNTVNFSPNFNNNWWTGLIINSRGAVTLMDVNAQSNGQYNFFTSDNGGTIDDSVGYGIYIDNHNGTGSVTIGTSRVNWGNNISNNFLSGLEIYSSGAVTLSNMTNDNNGGYQGSFTGYNPLNDRGYGALVKNSTATTYQPVTVKGWNDFSGNYDAGLSVDSRGAITVSNLNANNSQGAGGAYLNNMNSGASSPQAVTLTGYIYSNNNTLSGLEIHTYGAITLNNIDSEGNGINGSYGYGAFLDNCAYNSTNCTATLARTVTINGNNTFNNNYTAGLEVHSLGAIKINNMNANGNTDGVGGGFGAYLDNSGGTSSSGITLTQNAYTNDNGDYGLQALSKGAIVVNVSDMWAGGNGGYGWYLDNNFSGTTSPVTLSTSSSNSDYAFDPWGNGSYGLLVESMGTITVAGLDSGSNGGFGAELDNAFPGSTGAVTITTLPTGGNYFDNNVDAGLVILSNRAITVNNLEASNNGGSGAVFDNTYSGDGSPQNVTIKGYGDFYSNGNDGLNVQSHGVIALNNLDSDNNGQNNFNAVTPDPSTGWGAYLDNCGFVWDTGTPSNSDCTSTGAPKGITLTGSNTFDGNFQDGLWATSYGAISAKQLTANDNGGDGAYLDNQWDGAVSSTSTVTVTSASTIGSNNFGNNGYGFQNGWTEGDGLEVYSNRAVTLNNIQANGNYADGAWAGTASHTNPYAANAQNVTFTGQNIFLNNGYDGLGVAADGNITINNLTARGNNGDEGAYLDNCLLVSGTCTGHGNITLTGINTFNDNNGDGLYATSHGNVILNNVTADNNRGRGVYTYTTGTLLVSCGSMTNNVSYGWEFWSSLTITLKAVFAYGNNGGLGNTSPHGTLVTSLSCP